MTRNLLLSQRLSPLSHLGAKREHAAWAGAAEEAELHPPAAGKWPMFGHHDADQAPFGIKA